MFSEHTYCVYRFRFLYRFFIRDSEYRDGFVDVVKYMESVSFQFQIFAFRLFSSDDGLSLAADVARVQVAHVRARLLRHADRDEVR